MDELDIKLTAIADGIRELSGDTEPLGLDDMAQGTQTANAEISNQEELLAQVAVALENKVSGYERGKKEGFAEALSKRTDLIVTENGEYTPSEESTGFKSVSVNVQAKSKLPQVIDKTVTELAADDFGGVTKIGTYAFYFCTDLTSVTLPEGITTIGSNAFYGCGKIKSITIPYGVTKIELQAFYSCGSLENVTIPESVTSLGQSLFVSCTNLASITIPPNITSLPYQLFRGCTALSVVTMKRTTPPSLQSTAFLECTALKKIIVPVGSADAYKANTNWSVYGDIIVEEEL